MDARDLEAFAQFLQMGGASGGSGAARKPSYWETFNGKAVVSVTLFAASVALFRNFGESLL